MTSPPRKSALEIWLERGLLASRWLMAPFYVGLIASLAVLLAVFVQELAHELPIVVREHDPEDAILMALSLIDLSLAGNLVLIVIFAGYSNFVSKLDSARDEDRPEGARALDFSGLKMRLIASLVAISAVALLRAFMALEEPGANPESVKLGWLVGIHLTFVVSGLMLALMDRLERRPAEH